MLAILAGLFAWSFLAATVLPLGSEVPLVLAVHRLDALVLPVAVATAGNLLGACTTFWLGRRVAARVRRSPTPREERALRALRRWGPLALALSWVPLLGDVLVAVAGATGVPFRAFLPWTFAGKFARYVAVAWTAHALAG